MKELKTLQLVSVVPLHFCGVTTEDEDVDIFVRDDQFSFLVYKDGETVISLTRRLFERDKPLTLDKIRGWAVGLISL